MTKLLPALLAACGLLACSGHETTPTGHETEFGHTVERYSDLCHFDFADDSFAAAKRLSTHQWAKDRYTSGLEIEWDIRDRTLRKSPVMRQALNLVADTLYAMVLPTKGISKLELFVDIADLSDGDYGWTTAQGGGDFYASGDKRGFPVSGAVGITIDDYELEDIYDKPRYISSLAHWYTIVLHEAFHVLGFGTSPKWDSLITTRRYDDFICGKEIFYGHWSFLSHEGVGYPLMLSSIFSSKVLIEPETICALEGIGWDIRQPGEGARRSAPAPTPSEPSTDTGDTGTLPIISLRSTTSPVSEGSTLTVTVGLSAASASTVRFRLSTFSGSAKAADDYIVPNASISISAGDTGATATVRIKEDGVSEGTETFRVGLLQKHVTGATVGKPDKMTVEITD